jgi:hypothetical protein
MPSRTILSVVGARPSFMKVAALHRALARVVDPPESVSDETPAQPSMEVPGKQG